MLQRGAPGTPPLGGGRGGERKTFELTDHFVFTALTVSIDILSVYYFLSLVFILITVGVPYFLLPHPHLRVNLGYVSLRRESMGE